MSETKTRTDEEVLKVCALELRNEIVRLHVSNELDEMIKAQLRNAYELGRSRGRMDAQAIIQQLSEQAETEQRMRLEELKQAKKQLRAARGTSYAITQVTCALHNATLEKSK